MAAPRIRLLLVMAVAGPVALATGCASGQGGAIFGPEGGKQAALAAQAPPVTSPAPGAQKISDGQHTALPVVSHLGRHLPFAAFPGDDHDRGNGS